MTSAVILNDTSRFHHGSAAVMDYIFGEVRALGWDIPASFFGNTFIIENAPPDIDDDIVAKADVLIINGEGTLHHDSQMAVFLLDLVEKYRAKKICLVNTVWQAMSDEHARKLKHVDLIVARDHRSFKEISAFYDGSLHLAPDFSYLNVPILAPMADQGTLFGGFYWGQHARTSGTTPAKLALKSMDRTNGVDITKENWHVVVNRLRHAGLLVTGKHHDVMAACVARCPFLFCPIPTHKISALGDYADMELQPIDMSLTEQQYLDLFAKTIENRSSYDRLFDAMARSAANFSLKEALQSVMN